MKNYVYISYSLLIAIIFSAVSCSYLPTEITDITGISIEEQADYIMLTPEVASTNKAGIIFYPGGLVDPHAYIAAFQDLVIAEGRTMVIVKATSNLAILNTGKGSAILDRFPAISRWVIGGHSLGGSVACIDISSNALTFDGLFLLASYSVDDLSETEIPVISITGSTDEILDLENFNDNKVNLPQEIIVNNTSQILGSSTAGNTIYYEIDGGNHAQFGSYGEQNGDGTATIDSEVQQSLVREALRNFFLSNNL